MSYELSCQGATSLPAVTSDVISDCASAGGTLAYVEATSVLPELTLADGASIAGAILGLWAFAWCLRAIRSMIEES